MDDDTNPQDDAEMTNEAKKLTLNKETIQELSDDQLDDIAGGIGGTKGNPCRERTFAPACPLPGTITDKCNTQICPSQLTCGCPGV